MQNSYKVQLHSVSQRLSKDSSLVHIDSTAKGSAPSLFRVECSGSVRVVGPSYSSLQYILERAVCIHHAAAGAELHRVLLCKDQHKLGPHAENTTPN